MTQGENDFKAVSWDHSLALFGSTPYSS